MQNTWATYLAKGCLAFIAGLALTALAQQEREKTAAAEPVASPIAGSLTAAEARDIGREAYIYGNPLVDSYRILYTFFVDEEAPEFKASWNQLYSMARVFTHEDTTVQAANSDTPYSFAGIDLRTEPVVMTVPAMEASRYFSIQLVDLYTHIIDYIGTRTTGNGGGHYLLVENPISRYLLNSTMMDSFVLDADGGITFYIQHMSPGVDKEANWLPAPDDPFSVNMRLYWPQKSALDGTWQQPPLVRAEDTL